jgi:hypothetical protein
VDPHSVLLHHRVDFGLTVYTLGRGLRCSDPVFYEFGV